MPTWIPGFGFGVLALPAAEGGGALPGFTPSGSPVAHWSADTIPGLEDDDPVGIWPDQSGNGKDLTQGVAAQKPTYKINIQNSLPIVRFNGNNRLEIVDNIHTGVEGSFYAVYANTGDSNNTVICSSDTTSNEIYVWHRVYDPGDEYTCFIWRSGGIQHIPYGDTHLNTGFYLHTQESSDTAYTLRINGSDEGLTFLVGSDTGNWWGDIARNVVTMGARQINTGYDTYLTGDIAEVLMYDTKNSGADRTTNETGLNGKWAVY